MLLLLLLLLLLRLTVILITRGSIVHGCTCIDACLISVRRPAGVKAIRPEIRYASRRRNQLVCSIKVLGRWLAYHIAFCSWESAHGI